MQALITTKELGTVMIPWTEPTEAEAYGQIQEVRDVPDVQLGRDAKAHHHTGARAPKGPWLQ
jgi:hypothetical protein